MTIQGRTTGRQQIQDSNPHPSRLKLKFFTQCTESTSTLPGSSLPVQTLCENNTRRSPGASTTWSREISGQWVSPWLRGPPRPAVSGWGPVVCILTRQGAAG